MNGGAFGAMKAQDHSLFFNREASWLEFNKRVLAEAENPGVPLLERLKFLAITASNLDEFFMVRVAEQKVALREGAAKTGPDRWTPEKVLGHVASQCEEMIRRQYRCLEEDLVPGLNACGMEFLRPHEYSPSDGDFLEAYVREQVLPVLTPLAVDPGHPFPLLANGAIYIFFQVQISPRKTAHGEPPAADDSAQPFPREVDTILVQSPAGLSRFVKLPGRGKAVRTAALHDVIATFPGRLLEGYDVRGAFPFRVLRDADYELDEGMDDLITAVERELRSRRWGAPVRLDIPEGTPPEVRQMLISRLELLPEDVYHLPGMPDLKGLFQLAELSSRHDLRYPPRPPCPHPRLRDVVDVFKAIRERDVLLHHPYQSFDHVVKFVETAAADPDVLAIKMTLYRVAGDSSIIQALAHAAERGKQVTALVELRARFDEESNIQWARRLAGAGAHVIYGVMGFKTHAKACLVVRRERDGIRRYVHLSTGNYNDGTARVYTDIGYMTARPDICADVGAFFNTITGYSRPPRFHRLCMAPTELRRRLVSLVEREVARHSDETPSLIRAKMNALIDPEIIHSLYDASRAGVTVELAVRGMCRLRPGLPGVSEKIVVRGVVDRFLEHPRIFHFHNGGADEVYLSSADWMERNFDGRLELMFPVLDEEAKEEVVAVLDAAMADNEKSWQLQPDGTYTRLGPSQGERGFRSQEELYARADRMAHSPRPGRRIIPMKPKEDIDDL